MQPIEGLNYRYSFKAYNSDTEVNISTSEKSLIETCELLDEIQGLISEIEQTRQRPKPANHYQFVGRMWDV